MISRKTSAIRETKFERSYEIQIGNRTILSGEVIKINGEHGAKFKFISLVTNKETGVTWIDCFELDKNTASAWRSFKPDRIKVMPIKRGKRNVN
jgi:hypothetical protein